MSVGGGWLTIAQYANYLTMRGHEVNVISVLPRRKIQQKLRNLFRQDPRAVPRADLLEYRFNLKTIERKSGLCEEDAPDADMVIATWWETALWVYRLSAKKGKKVYFIQGHEVWSRIPIEISSQTYNLPFFRIAVSEWLANTLASTYGITKPTVVLNGIDLELFKYKARVMQNIPTVGFLLSGHPVKGLDLLELTLLSLKKEFPNLRAICAGHSPTDFMKRFAWVECRGLVSRVAMKELYTNCDVWLSASRSEGFNLTVVEAMACGTPAIVSQTGWPCDGIRHGVNGWSYPVEDSTAFSHLSISALKLPEKDWKEISFQAAKSVAELDISNAARSFEHALLNVVKN